MNTSLKTSMFAKALKEKKMSSWFNTDIPVLEHDLGFIWNNFD